MNYRLKVMLSDSKIIVPNGIYFHLIVPDDITFLQLHKIIMAATNYLDYHLWTFMFKDNYEVKFFIPTMIVIITGTALIMVMFQLPS